MRIGRIVKALGLRGGDKKGAEKERKRSWARAAMVKERVRRMAEREMDEIIGEGWRDVPLRGSF